MTRRDRNYAKEYEQRNALAKSQGFRSYWHKRQFRSYYWHKRQSRKGAVK